MKDTVVYFRGVADQQAEVRGRRGAVGRFRGFRGLGIGLRLRIRIGLRFGFRIGSRLRFRRGFRRVCRRHSLAQAADQLRTGELRPGHGTPGPGGVPLQQRRA